MKMKTIAWVLTVVAIAGIIHTVIAGIDYRNSSVALLRADLRQLEQHERGNHSMDATQAAGWQRLDALGERLYIIVCVTMGCVLGAALLFIINRLMFLDARDRKRLEAARQRSAGPSEEKT